MLKGAVLALLCLSGIATFASASPTPEEYVAKVGADAKVVPANELAIDGRKVICGKRPTVLDNKLDDYGAAYPASSSSIQSCWPRYPRR